jgi:H+/Cl- antiporter ClcA
MCCIFLEVGWEVGNFERGCFLIARSSYVLQVFGSIGSVGGGLALGKEGPLVHTGACIASLLGQVRT